jgi:hypothetical protein
VICTTASGAASTRISRPSFGRQPVTAAQGRASRQAQGHLLTTHQPGAQATLLARIEIQAQAQHGIDAATASSRH